MGLTLILVGILGVLISSIVLYLYYVSLKHAKYFKKRGVPYLGGGYLRMFKFMFGKISIVDVEMEMYALAKKTKSPIVGYTDAFVNPGYFVVDLDLARSIYIKDFDYFMDRRKFETGNTNKMFSKMVVAMEGAEWKGMRSKLSPTFTTGKIKRVFGIFERSGNRMCDYLEKIVGPKGNEFDVLQVFSKFSMDVIASCAFGIDSKSFECPPEKDSRFDEMGKRFQVKFKASTLIKFIFIMAAPKLADKMGIEGFDKEPVDYFTSVITEVMTHRRKTGEKQDDFLQLMMDAQNGLLKNEENSKETMEVMTGSDSSESANANSFKQVSEKIVLDDDSIISNCVLFLLAGFDTLQSLLIFAAYQLAVSQDVQEKLRQEVEESMDSNGGKLTYDGVSQMNYLDMFINETLRIFPPAARTERMCTKSYKVLVPGMDVVIDKGIILGLPVVGVHHDEDYYDDPEKFDPERFLPNKKGQRHPYSFSPFGHGPRNCIGMRFALTEAKTVIAVLVKRFKIEPCTKTEIPVTFGNFNSLKPKGGVMFLNFTPRTA